jgi:predicted O-linked N-acetylglucosamine transferase (SPINDLY family)
VLYLPGCYLPRDKIDVPEELTPTKESLGLEKFERVYCAFNHEYKITPNVFSGWMAILSEDPSAAIWLRTQNKQAKKNLLVIADNNSIPRDRLVYCDRTPAIENHLARFRLAHAFFDTHPYGGHTTTSDAAAMSCQINTTPGRTFQSRVGAAIIGLTSGFTGANDILAILNDL